jgi:signal transduction histidine kinase
MLPVKKLTIVDQLFAILRLLVIVGGIAWMLLSPISESSQTALFFTYVFFCFYSIILYILIFLNPANIRTVYIAALFLDLIFLSLLVRWTGGLQSEFFLAFMVLIALHSFYFGIKFGIAVAVSSSLMYLLAGSFEVTSANFPEISLRIVFFLLTGASMGLIAEKEVSDKQKIRKLNKELELRTIELEQEKDKLSMILTGVNAGLVLLDKNKTILWTNWVIEESFQSLHKIQGRECNKALWGNEDICKNCPAERSLLSGKLEKQIIERWDENDNASYYKITAAPLYDKEGNFDKILELIQDVTEEKELQLHLVHSSKLAAIGELASGVAHEINNPLGSISVCVKEISETINANHLQESSYDEMQDCLDSIKKEINRCKQITTDLLHFARKSNPRRVPVDINQLLQNVVTLVRYKAQKEQKKIHLHLDSKLLIILGNGDELTQVFLNLILNAQDFSPSGGSIDVYAGRKDQNNIYVHVKDEGSGIPPENLERIFNPFFSTKTSGKGTGLGLPISLRIVEAHGGRLKVDSQLNKGTTISVILPSNRQSN